jgi:uncharacterized protein YkwD
MKSKLVPWKAAIRPKAANNKWKLIVPITTALFFIVLAGPQHSTLAQPVPMNPLASQARVTHVRAPPASGTATTDTLEMAAFDLLNDLRLEKGLSRLQWSDEVAAIARAHSEDMARVNFFSHRGADGSMVDDRAERFGLKTWRAIGENIAYLRGFADPARIAVEKWLESTSHRHNALDPQWRESAIGVAVGIDGTYFFTQVFLARK